MEEENKNNINLKRKIILEYVYIVGYFLVSPIIYFLGVENATWDTLGTALASEFILIIMAIFVFIINPIRIIISYKVEFKAILSKNKKKNCYFIAILPVFLTILMVCYVLTYAYMYNRKYYSSKSAYYVSPDDYKTAKDFEKELDGRGLLYNNYYEKLLSKLNEKYYISKNFEEYYYEEASLMVLPNSIHDRFFDQKDANEIISFDSYEKAPVYIYNCILTLPSQSEKLQYAPISRFAGKTSILGINYPYYNDYYIECKIFYVDGQIYAVIGLDESFDISKYFSENSEKYNYKEYLENPPYYMILSEKDTITTFVDGNYHSKGAIRGIGSELEMELNTAGLYYGGEAYNYPIRKVEKLDVDTINSVAQELQEGLLKESIKYHTENMKLNTNNSNTLDGSLSKSTKYNVESESNTDFFYTLDANGNAMITAYNGTESNLTIPSQIGIHKVVAIGSHAFNETSNSTNGHIIKNLVISEGIERIGLLAFARCENLETVKLPESLTFLDMQTFLQCSKLKSINIPSKIESIASSTFQETGLTEIDIPKNVKKLDCRAFALCRNLKKVTIHNNDISFYSIVPNYYLEDGSVEHDYKDDNEPFYNCPEDLVLYANEHSTTKTYAQEKGIEFKILFNNE